MIWRILVDLLARLAWRAAIVAIVLFVRWRRSAPEASWVRDAHGPGWALIGDAGLHQDRATCGLDGDEQPRGAGVPLSEGGRSSSDPR